MTLLKKEELYNITDLSADKISAMSDEQLLAYREALYNAANLFPVQKARLEEALAKMDYPPALQWLKAIRNSLTRIHATALVSHCDKQLALNSDPENMRHDRFKAFVDFFIATLTLLYTDIQLLLEKTEMPETGTAEDRRIKGIRERLATISELRTEALENKNDAELIEYAKTLLAFVATSRDNEDALQSTLRMKNYASLMNWLGVTEATLLKIHADTLAEECRHQINKNPDYAAIRHDKFVIAIDYILTSLSMLRNDIASLKIDFLLNPVKQ